MKKLPLLLVLLLTGCSHIERATVNGQIRDAWNNASDAEFIRTRGIGVPPEKAVGKTRRRGLSRNSALVSARYEMLAVVKGIKVGGGLTIGDLIQRDSRIREAADRIISGAVEAQTEFTASDDGCVVTLELRRDAVPTLLERDRPYEEPPLVAAVAPAPAPAPTPQAGPRGFEARMPGMSDPKPQPARSAEDSFYMPPGFSGPSFQRSEH